MQAQSIIDLINSITNDTGNVTYPLSEVILAINDAQRLVCVYRPDANSSTSNFSLSAGTKQVLPSTARRLLGIVRNMGVDGNTSGSAIRFSVSFDDLNLFDPDWHNEIGSEVLEYTYDESRPDEFFITPGVTPPFYIEIKTTDNTIDIVSGSSDIEVNASYAPCLVSWACYRLFSRDGTESPNYARGESHKQTVFDILGIKSQADAQVSPNK